MATEIDSIPSPPRLPSELVDLEHEALSNCQVDVRMDTDLGPGGNVQQMVGMGGDLPQASIGAAEVSIKMLMSSKVSILGEREVEREEVHER